MLRKFIVRLTVNATSLWFAAWLFEYGFVSSLYPNLFSRIGFFLSLGLIFTLVNMVIRPILRLLSLPIIILTLGIFTLVINGLMVMIAWQLAADYALGWTNAIATGLIVSLANFLVTNNFKE